MNPILIKIIVVLVLLASAFTAGVYVESDHRDAQLLTRERAYVADYKKEVKRSAQLGKKLREKKNATAETFKRVDEQVAALAATPGYSNNVCLDDVGLRAVNDALRGSTSAGRGNGPLPGTHTTE